MVKNICTVCKKSYLVKPYRKDISFYCSHKCYGLSKKGKAFYSMLGIKHSKKTRKKMSLSAKGKNTWSKGRKLSQKHRTKISLANKAHCTGSKRWNWKNGRVAKDGYALIINPNRFNGDKRRYILEHRFIMERHLGRKLSNTEIVHHINEIKNDNYIKNLRLFASVNAHLSFHRLENKKQETSISQMHFGQV